MIAFLFITCIAVTLFAVWLDHLLTPDSELLRQTLEEEESNGL